MTNAEYIKQHLTDLDLAYYEFPHAVSMKDRPSLFSEKIYSAWYKWAESTSNNFGNMAKGLHHGTYLVEENPSIWAWEKWHYPDDTWRTSGRNHIVSFLVWLSKQYDQEDWREDD